MRIALFGGTFNPPHQGHVHVTDLLTKRFDEVWLVVANDPNKKEKPYVKPVHRLAMAKLAVSRIPGAKVSDVEIRRGGASFTTETLTELLRVYPEHQFTWVIGSDLLLDFPRWKNSKQLAQSAHFAVVSRPGYLISKGALTPFRYIQVIQDEGGVDASSTQIRQWIHQSNASKAETLLLDEVWKYILENKLYAIDQTPESCR